MCALFVDARIPFLPSAVSCLSSPTTKIHIHADCRCTLTLETQILRDRPGIFFSPPDRRVDGAIVARFSNGAQQTFLLCAFTLCPALTPELTVRHALTSVC
jgi:hypothetical protein